MAFVCPQCKGSLEHGESAYRCPACALAFPILCGIPDFRLWPDPYIGIEGDRRKGQLLFEACRTRGFREMLDHYYAITAEDPPDLAARWKAHALKEVDIARDLLQTAGLLPPPKKASKLLDLGCSTGGLMIAAAGQWENVTGVDVAFRWLVIGSLRLREAGVDASLICANSEALPFGSESFDAAVAVDLMEHLRDPEQGAREAARVLRPGGAAVWASNNRWCPLAEPHVHLWGVGYLPRRWQAAYVRLRRKDLHPYGIRVPSWTEMRRTLRRAGHRNFRIEPAPLPVSRGRNALLRSALGFYNRFRTTPVIRELATWLGPRLWSRATR